jgi:hypothetical protein
MQMLLTPALNLLLACPKNVAAGTTFGPYRKIRKLTICTGKSAPLITFLLKNFAKILIQVFKETKTIYWHFRVTQPKSSQVFANLKCNILGGKYALPRNIFSKIYQ